MQLLTNLSELGREVARLRNEKGMTQRELSALCGLAQPTLARFETGRVAEFGSRKLLLLLQVLGHGLCVSAAPQQFTLDDALAERRLEGANSVRNINGASR